MEVRLCGPQRMPYPPRTRTQGGPVRLAGERLAAGAPPSSGAALQEPHPGPGRRAGKRAPEGIRGA